MAEKLEADIRANAAKLTAGKSAPRPAGGAAGGDSPAPRPAGRGIDVSAEDFDDE